MIKKDLLKLEINGSDIRYALRYGIPLVPHVLGSAFISFADRIFITKYVNIGEAGIYAVSAQIAMAISLLTTSFNRAYTPYVFRKLKIQKLSEYRKIVVFTYVYSATLFAITILYIIGATLATPIIVGPEFEGVANFLPWLCFGYFFNGLYYMVSVYIFYSERTEFILCSTSIAAILNIVLNAILVPKFGAIGAAQATTTANCVLFLCTWYMANRVIKIPWLIKLPNILKSYNY